MAILKVFHIGKNKIVPEPTMNGEPWYKYEYKRTCKLGGTHSSFSNNLQELYDRLNKEIEEAINGI